MDKKFTKELKNALTVKVDYIAYTVTDPSVSVDDVILMMGFVPSDFIELPRGGFGYKKQKKNESNGISVLYDGGKNMGIHVNVTGSAVGNLLEAYQSVNVICFDGSSYLPLEEQVLSMFFQDVLKIGHFTRLDTAIDDDGGRFFSPADVYDLYQNSQVLSKWRTVKRHDIYKNPGVCSGYTVYFGSRESALMLRIYDKALETNNRFKPGDDGYIDHDWYRWELEYKDERADELARLIISGSDFGSAVVGVLAYYIRLINLDDSNRSRCSSLEKWVEFITCLEASRLNIEKKVKTVYDKLTWVDNQVAPTLATLLLLYNFDTQFLYDIASKSFNRISKSDWELVRLHRPEIYATYHVEGDFDDFE